MKKRLKILILTLIGCLIIVGILSVFINKSKATDTDEITIMAPLNGISEPQKDNKIEVGIKELTGENIKIIWIPEDSYKEKTMAMMASGEFPDILVSENETEDIVKGVEQGGFWNIGSYLKDYPNLSNADESILKNSSFNGENYGIYRYKNPIDNCILLRKDWMEKLNIKNPTTIDEFTEILKKFTYDDPDGNGVNDTYGLSIPGSDYNTFNSLIEQIAAWFGAPNKWKDENGELKPSFMTEEYKKSLDYIKKLYDEKLIDPKFHTKNTSDIQENFKNNQLGVIMCKKADALKLENVLSAKNENNSNLITAISGIKGNNEGKILTSSGYSGMLMFPKRGIKTEDRLKRVLNFVDKLNSKEMYMLLNYGVEGENYTIENSNIKTIENISNYNLLSYSEIRTNCRKENIFSDNKKQFINELNAATEIPEKDKAINIAEPLKIQGHVQNQNKLQETIEELNAKYIFGEIDNSEYEKGINDWLDNGGEDYIQKVNELYNKYLNK
ncbi:extracellular solute-binding protein [Clostridium sp. SHJSY1]|uniref:extracellular solute-binding protein n=1 Tax=Clostridium sp. SHJSY1 TaxID=2942483 RepID=UPI002875F025|nr:extracellular solute-binding protein [Clostridium sp. SHJSY1]MDS0525649.1 extracellular solute-binding protein [Clostridium sp. SHJSY1]